jgi:serine/threonine-protein kinase
MLLDGRFRLEALLGRGGMAEVFRATDLQHHRPVAVKILRSDVLDVIGVERFRREIAVTAAFTHSHILGLLESGETTGPDGARVLYYVMPLIEGETLRDRLRREDHLPLRDALRTIREVLEALQYAHEHGVIHRDIKPANILLSGGHAVVADFGIARPILREDRDGGALDSLTVSGVAVGTPAYMSPEQVVAGATVDTRSDLYAAGCVLYEMLTGRTPFDASTGQAVIARKMTGIFASPSTMRPGLPPLIDDIAAHALQPDPADRFATAAEFLAAVDLLGDTTPLRITSTVLAPPGAPVPFWRRRLFVPAIVTLSVVVLGAWLWTRSRTTGSAPAPIAADPARVAVVPFENLSADTSLAYVANGLTTDLIDELAQVRALTVVSKNGVVPLLAKGISVDSLARVLRVGSVITGDVRRAGSGVAVSVRLVDGRTGQQLASQDTSGAMQDLLGVRSAVVQKAARFLRVRLGEQVRMSTARSRASNPEAWQLVERVRSLRNGELNQAWQLAPADRARRFQHADSLALVASRLDKFWPEPLVERALLSMREAINEETASLAGTGTADAGRDAAARLYRDAVHWSDRALARDANDASALRVRGASRIALWRISRDATSDSLRVRAEADLRSALDHRPDLAPAWNDLSSLLSLSGDFAQAEQAAAEALRTDEYLANAGEVLARLQFSALGAEHTENAVKWCAEGRRRYPDDQRFFACELTTLGRTSDQPSDVGRAWQILQDAEKRYSPDVLRSGWATRRLFVAAIAARANMRDSAMAIVSRTRTELPAGASSVTADYGEAQVRALLGQTDEAIRFLERYLNSFPIQRRQVARTPWFKSLRADPRFVAMTAAR